MENKRTLLQKVLGDDNVLIVKFMVPSDKSTFDFYRQHYHKVAEDGIIWVCGDIIFLVSFS
jgi:RNA-dependent RNA polymerase